MAAFRFSISICLLRPLEHSYHHQGRHTYMHELANGYLTRHGGLKVRCSFFFFFGGWWGGLKLVKPRVVWVTEKLGQLNRGEWGPTGFYTSEKYNR